MQLKIAQLLTYNSARESFSHHLLEILSLASCSDKFFPTKEHNLQCNDLTAPGLPQLIEKAFSLTHHNSASHGFELLKISYYAALFAPWEMSHKSPPAPSEALPVMTGGVSDREAIRKKPAPDCPDGRNMKNNQNKTKVTCADLLNFVCD